jgi:protease PrsW
VATAVPASEPGRTPALSPGLRRHGWIIVLAVGVALFVLVERTLVLTANPNFVPLAILLGSATVPAAFVAFVYGRRLGYGVPATVVAACAFFGGVVGTVVAGRLEFDAQRDLGVLPMIGVGLIEEASKLLAPLAVLLLVRAHRTRADGLLVGVAAGAGFAAMETMGYAFTTLVSSRGSLVDTVDVLLLRGAMSPAAHMAWTGITAAALFGAVELGGRHRVAGFLGAFVVAVALHTAWDSQRSTIGMAVVALLSLLALGVTVHRAAPAHPARQPHAAP